MAIVAMSGVQTLPAITHLQDTPNWPAEPPVAGGINITRLYWGQCSTYSGYIAVRMVVLQRAQLMGNYISARPEVGSWSSRGTRQALLLFLLELLLE